MFGKTRLTKSNVVKLIAQGMLDATAEDDSVGQLIFDVNGEYANDNEPNTALPTANPGRCQVYALVQRAETPSKPLRLNFDEQPDSCIQVLASKLGEDERTSIHVQSFSNVTLPPLPEIAGLPIEERDRPVRIVLTYWAVLHKAGFQADPKRLLGLGLSGANASGFSPHFSKPLREAAYDHASGGQGSAPPPHPGSLNGLVGELEVIARFALEKPKDKALKSTGSGEPILDADDLALLKFLAHPGAGPTMLRPYRGCHAADASHFVAEVLDLLDRGRTVILDVGNATDTLRRYFADLLSRAVFAHQEGKFVTNRLGGPDGHFVQLYFEEAHNLFPVDDKDLTGVYARFAKEGAKFHIGMVYSTQSPSAINRELLAQTENFFVGHMSSQDETKALAKVQVAFADHLAAVPRSAPPRTRDELPTSATLSHEYVRREVQRGRAFAGQYGYGEKTNWGEKVYHKLDPGTYLVLNVPTGRYDRADAFPTPTDLIGLDRILATVPGLVSREHVGAMFPIELANGIASMSSYPSAKILERFLTSR